MFQLLLTGSFDGADVFDKSKASSSQPRFLSNVRLVFGVGGNAAMPNQCLFYMQCLASLVKRDFNLEYDNLVPDTKDNVHMQQLCTLFNFDVEEESNDVHQKQETLCFALAKQFSSKQAEMTIQQRHVFLVLWSFWAISKYKTMPLSNYTIDLMDFKSLLPCTNITTFVLLAK